MRSAPLAFAGMVAACAAPVSLELSTAQLPDAPRPELRVGESWAYETPMGERIEQRVLAVVDGSPVVAGSFATRQPNVPCVVTLSRDVYAPHLGASGCSLPDYVADVSGNGSLFPLRVGNGAVWQVTMNFEDGRSDGYRYVCSVPSTARVSVPAGTYDVFVIECDSGFRQQTYYYAPSIETHVLFRRKSRTDGSVEASLIEEPT
ncbi:MAG: hypothetical protein AAF968_27135 [Pseudomonadota bacterium]